MDTAPKRPRGRPKGTPQSEETRTKISASKRGKRPSLETRRKIGSAMRKVWASYDRRARATIRGREQYLRSLGGIGAEEARVRAKYEQAEAEHRGRRRVVEAREIFREDESPRASVDGPSEAERPPRPQLPEPQGDLSIFQKVLWKVLKAEQGYAMTPGERRTLAMGRDRGAFDEAEIAVVEALLAPAQA